jgi:hypothetical protein
MFDEWTKELKGMADRIISMRHQLFDALKTRGTISCQVRCFLFAVNIVNLQSWEALLVDVSFIISPEIFYHKLV